MAGKICKSLTEVAYHLEKSPATIRNWRGKGMPGEAGNWNIDDIIAWRAQAMPQYKEKRIDHDFPERPDRPDDAEDWLLTRRKAEARVKAADAESKERRNRIAEGKLIERDQVEPAIAEAITGAKLLFAKIPEEMMPLFPREHRNQLAEELDNKIRLVLTRLADWLTSNVEEAFEETEPEGEE